MTGPKQSFMRDGWRPTNRRRVRNRGWLLGAIVEELMEHRDGQLKWQPALLPLRIYTIEGTDTADGSRR